MTQFVPDRVRFYSTLRWQKTRAKVKKLWRAQGLPCAYCKQNINYSKGAVVDHIINRHKRPDLAYELSNLQVLCSRECNTKKYYDNEANNKPQIGMDGYPDDWR